MRILVVTNLFPPVVVGGYEIGCERLVSRLRSRGHEVVVLTSSWGRDNAPRQPGVHRVLPLSAADQGPTGLGAERPSPSTRLWREFRSQRAVRRALRRDRPDVTYAFNTRFISRSVLFLARESGPVVYFASDPWLADDLLEDEWVKPWERLVAGTRPLGRLWARLLSAAISVRVAQARFGPQDLEHVQFASDALRQAAIRGGRQVTGAEVIHWGVDLTEFAPRAPIERVQRFLYAGQLLPHKGVKTALAAFLELCRLHPEGGFQLTLVGGTTWPRYASELGQLVEEAGMEGRVTFAGSLSKEEMPAVYAAHDALVFPSEWEEPFSIALVEAMAVGLPIICTMTGGTPEIVVPEHNALTFDAGDAAGCRRQMERLSDVALARALQTAARETVESCFTLEAMVDAVEASLRAAARV